MKRKHLLQITECAAARFETLQAREQLPFPSQGRGGEYGLWDAVLLRALLALVAPDNEGRAALGVDLASCLVLNAAGIAAMECGGTAEGLAGSRKPTWFVGAEFVDQYELGKDGAPLRWLAWYAGPADGIGEFLTAASGRPLRIVGAVNATELALDVIERARKLGVSDAE